MGVACGMPRPAGRSPTFLKTLENALLARFSPDGKKIVTADYEARVWDAQSGEELTEPMRHGGVVYPAQFSPDGTRILTASQDKTARVWDAQNGQSLVGPMLHGSELNSAEFSPGWDANRHGFRRRHGAHLGRANRRASHRAVETPEFCRERALQSGWEAHPYRFLGQHRLRGDAQTGRRLLEPMKHGEGVLRADFSPDGQRILTCSWDNTARLWDAQTGLRIAEPMKHSDVIVAAEFSPDGKRILTASHDGTARIWDVQTGQPLTEPMKHRDALLGARFSPDGRRVATACFDHTARVWDVGPNPDRFPDWLCQLSEAISGQVLNNQAVLEPTKLNRLETIDLIRDRLMKAEETDEWVVWGRWLWLIARREPSRRFLK